MSRPKPQLVTAKLSLLHPTQITVGKAEVALKREAWSHLNKKARSEALAQHWFPTIIGPEEKHYIVDHHHFGLALLEEEVNTVSLMVLKDLSDLAHSHFWLVMDHYQWVHPYDNTGARREFTAVPHHLGHLEDDPYRSLAGEVRRAGGFAKDVTPFSEFLWADFFRYRIPFPDGNTDLTAAIKKALKIAHSQDASYLPGWYGTIAP